MDLSDAPWLKTKSQNQGVKGSGFVVKWRRSSDCQATKPFRVYRGTCRARGVTLQDLNSLRSMLREQGPPTAVLVWVVNANVLAPMRSGHTQRVGLRHQGRGAGTPPTMVSGRPKP